MTQLRTFAIQILKSVLETLEHNSELANAWFEVNYMELNTDKRHLLISENENEHMWEKLDKDIALESNDVKLLGIIIDKKIKFDKHVSNICSKVNRKLSAFTRVAKFLPFRLLLSCNSYIAHSYGCFMECKLMIR